MTDIEVGDLLYYSYLDNKQFKSRYVRVTHVLHDRFCVGYEGRDVWRSNDVIGKTLFKRKYEADDFIRELVAYANKKKTTEPPNCCNCVKRSSDDCLASIYRTDVCDNYVRRYSKSEEITSLWPKHMVGPYGSMRR